VLELRGYQTRLADGVTQAWASGARHVLAVAPTGSGKTVLFSSLLAGHRGKAVAIAHRQELVSQISLSLARCGVRHGIIAPRSVIRLITQLHATEVGGCWYDPNADLRVAGVDTLIKRPALRSWCEQVTLWVQDEAHHVLRENKWGTAVGLFPNARGLGVTATPCRADGKGLGAHADGYFETMIEGPSMRELINEGYLSDYRIIAPDTKDLDLSDVPITSGGEFNQKRLRLATRRSHLVGDVVEHYLRWAKGVRGVSFTTDVEGAEELAERFRAAGVPAAAVSAKTPEAERYRSVAQFRAGKLLQLVNVDLFGEGFDLPAMGCVSMARPTHSFGVYTQQFGRPLRIAENKPRALVFDHVGNYIRHNGPPDFPRTWTLDRRDSRRKGTADPDAIPMKVCVNCTSPFEAYYRVCPWCSAPVVPSRRDGPEFVDGDLVELDAATLAELFGQREGVDAAPVSVAARMQHAGAPAIAIAGAVKQCRRRQESQRSLRNLIALYGGVQRARGRDISEGQRRFYHRYGVDILTAQSLGRPQAQELALRLIADIGGQKV